MNVLDRADKPWTMLKQIRSMLHPENVRGVPHTRIVQALSMRALTRLLHY